MFFVGVIYKGQLKNDQLFYVRHLSLQDIKEILFLQDDVARSLDNQDVLSTLSEKEYKYILSNNGLMLGVFLNNSLIAYRALLVPESNDPEHLGLDIGLLKKDLDQVIYQEISVVHPRFRGNRLQQMLARLIMKELRTLDQPFRYVCCTVAPFNIPSLKDKFNQGMHVMALKEKYSHKLRYIFMKDLQKDHLGSWEAIKDIPMSDIACQQQLLSDGWKGYSMKKRADVYYVSYGK